MQAECVPPWVLGFMSPLTSVYEFLSTIFLNFITNSGLIQFFMSVFFLFDFVVLFLLRSARNWFSLTFSLSGSCRGAVSRFMTNTAGITRRPRDCCWSSIRSGVSAHVYWWELAVQMCTYTYDQVSIIASVEVILHRSLIAQILSSEMLLICPANL